MQIIKSPNLAEYSSIHIGGLGNFLYLPQSENELLDILRSQTDFLVTGGGTNIIFSDSFNRDVVSCRKMQTVEVNLSAACMSIPAGVKLSRIVYDGVRAGFAGVEALAGIPGTIGGAVVMNAGSRYGSISEFVKSVTVFSFSSNSQLMLEKTELGFAYRTSILQNNSDYVVLAVDLEFKDFAPADRLVTAAKQIIKERITSRIRLPNCGSVFKNPSAELSAGAMVDHLGLKGFAIGGLAVSQLHGNIFVNTGGAVFADFAELTDCIRNKVFREYGVELELEIRVAT